MMRAMTLSAPSRRWCETGAALFILMLVLLPFSRLVALPVALLTLGGMGLLADDPKAMWRNPSLRTLLLVFLCWWIPQLVSAPDAINPQRAGSVTLASVRFLFLGIAMIYAIRFAVSVSVTRWICWLVLLWCVDALVQQMTGTNLVGMPISAERLNGVFGERNIKLGHVLAALSPIVLDHAMRRWPGWAFGVVYGLFLIVIILIGTRAGWIMYAVVSAVYLPWYLRKPRRGRYAMVAAIVVVVGITSIAAYEISPLFRGRIDRSAEVLSGDTIGLDEALGYRLPIWSAAVSMVADHPVNGVGPRGFRYVYERYAQPDDVWMARGGAALHAHHLFLELLTETGTIGLVAWLIAWWLLYQFWRSLDLARRRAALPYAVGLLATQFPLNTHLAFYSTFWSVVTWWLIIGFLAHGGRKRERSTDA